MILVKTEAGHQVLKDRSIRLTPRQRSAFILCDGRRSVSEVLDAGMGIVRGDIDELIELGLLGPMAGATDSVDADAAVSTAAAKASGPDSAPGSVQSESPVLTESAANAPVGVRSNQQRYKDAYPIATQLTASLGLRGFRLNLSVEGTSNYEDLVALAPKIRAAVGPEKAAALDRALND